MTKTAFEKQSSRLKDLKCPIHGMPMKRDEDNHDPDRPFVFRCINAKCEVRGAAKQAIGPITLDDEFAYLVDPFVGQLPLQTHSQERGLRAADIASIALSKIAFVHRVETGSDIGIDFICELRVDRKPTGKMFNVQCKALPVSFDPGETLLSFPIKVSTARYWLEQVNPTILIVADVDSGSLYWQDPVKILENSNREWRIQGEVSISVPKASSFNCFEGPPKAFVDVVTQGIGRVGRSLRERLYTVEKIIDNELDTGVNRESKDVAQLLLQSGSPISEAISVIKNVTEFQGAIFLKIVSMIADISSTVRKLHEDTFRKLHRVSGGKGPFENDPVFIEELNLLNSASGYAAAADVFSNTEQLNEAIDLLHKLESLHRSALERELQFEKRMDNLAELHESGGDCSWVWDDEL
ncbi:DUF4365 domain-containing protein [Noviherbaspirillum sp. 1P10PC]|uniref:DUF4365 domain-containing protein n=1 Tax=Noviherbaspirillum sp. 1P10PC TaxID=3132292 RepID=UPI0039A3CA5E